MLDLAMSCIWTVPTIPLTYDSSTLDIWLIEPTYSTTDHSESGSALSVDERERSTGYHFPADANRYKTTRLALRNILAKFYLKVDPSSLIFGYSQRGKPHLISPAISDLKFNVSHSENRALIAVTWGNEVGVDIELAKPLEDLRDISQRFFSKSESMVLTSLTGDEQIRTFYRIWTRKEAVLKATGDGLTKPLNSFTVVSDAAPIEISLDERSWLLTDITLDHDYFGAVCFASPKPKIRTFRWH
jgi:4'-phosphopantetheinyl transferase